MVAEVIQSSLIEVAQAGGEGVDEGRTRALEAGRWDSGQLIRLVKEGFGIRYPADRHVYRNP